MASALTEGLSPAQLDQFRVLRQRFVAGLPLRRLEIQNAPTWQARQAALHRLAGSAGSYGFERLHQVSLAAEHLSAGADHDVLARALAALVTEIDATGEGTPQSA